MGVARSLFGILDVLDKYFTLDKGWFDTLRHIGYLLTKRGEISMKYVSYLMITALAMQLVIVPVHSVSAGQGSNNTSEMQAGLTAALNKTADYNWRYIDGDAKTDLSVPELARHGSSNFYVVPRISSKQTIAFHIVRVPTKTSGIKINVNAVHGDSLKTSLEGVQGIELQIANPKGRAATDQEIATARNEMTRKTNAFANRIYNKIKSDPAYGSNGLVSKIMQLLVPSANADELDFRDILCGAVILSLDIGFVVAVTALIDKVAMGIVEDNAGPNGLLPGARTVVLGGSFVVGNIIWAVVAGPINRAAQAKLGLYRKN